MRLLVALLLLLPASLIAQVEVRRYGTMTELLSANPTAFSVAGKATVIVSGKTNSQDGWSRVLAYSSSDTNAADNLTIFSPTSTNIPGRYRLLYLENPTNSSVRAGILPPYQSGSVWLNGAWVSLASIFSAGTNMQVTVTSNSVSYGMTNATGASSIKWEGITIPDPNLKDTAYVYWTPSGSDLRANIVANSIDNSRLEEMQTGYIIGRYAGTFGTPEYISIGANLSLSGAGVLSAVVASGAANGTPVSVDGGGYLLGANFTDSSEIDHSVSGTNVSSSLVSNSISTNKFDSTALGLILNQHFVNSGTVLPLVLTNNVLAVPGRVVFGTNASGHVVAYATNIVSVNGTVVAPVNILNSAEISASVSSSTNVYFSLNSGSVAFSKLADVPSSSLLGRGTSGTGSVERVTLGTGLTLTTNGVLSATGTNTTVIRANGTQVVSPNIIDTSEVDVSISLSTNILFDLFPASVVFSKLQSIGTSKLLGRSSGGSGSIEQISVGSGLSLALGTLSATGTSGSVDTSTNYTWTGDHVFLGDVSFDSVTYTNLVVDNLQVPFADKLLYANSSSNIAQVTIGSGITFSGGTLSASGGGGGGGSSVYVDGVSVSSPNFSDAATTGLFDVSGTNVTIRLPDRDFGSVTVSSSGAAINLDTGSISSNHIAFGQVPQDKLGTSGTGTSTNFLAGDYSYKQITTNMIPGLNAILATIGSGGGSTTNDILQRVGYAEFTIDTGYSVVGLVTGGIVTNVTYAAGGVSTRGLLDFAISPARSGTNYVVEWDIEAEDPTGLGSPLGAVVMGSKTTTSFQLATRFTGSERMPNGAKHIVWILEPVSVSGTGSSGSDAITSISLPYGGFYWSPSVTGTNSSGYPNIDWTQSSSPNLGSLTVGWTNIVGIPAGFADGVDDTGGGGGFGTMTGITLTNSATLPFSFSPNSTTTSNTFTLSPSNQVANLVYAGPASGGSAAPTFRALVDADIPNTITVDLATTATTANSGDSATAFFSSGTVEDARIDSALARDSEVAAAYQPLDADLTAMGAGTAVATAQTNAVSVGAPTIYVGTTNLAAHVALKAPIASPAFTTSATIGGTNVLDYTATHLTEAEASALYQRTNINLTTVANLTGGTSTNFLAGDGTFKQVTTNMVPGLNAVLATIGGGSGEANTASNLGTPSSTVQGLYNSKALVDLRFRSIEAGSGITLTSNANTVAISSSGGSDTNWNGTPIESGTITNLSVGSISLLGNVRTNWFLPGRYEYYRWTDCDFGDNASAANYVLPWSATAINSGTLGLATAITNDSGVKITSSSSANSGQRVALWTDTILLSTNSFTEFTVRPLATNNTAVLSRIGFSDVFTSASLPVDGLYMNRDGMVVNLIARSNSVTTTSAASYSIASNTVYTGRISIADIGSGNVEASLELWDANPTLLTTIKITNGIPMTFGRETGHGWAVIHTNAVTGVPLEELFFMNVYGKKTR